VDHHFIALLFTSWPVPGVCRCPTGVLSDIRGMWKLAESLSQRFPLTHDIVHWMHTCHGHQLRMRQMWRGRYNQRCTETDSKTLPSPAVIVFSYIPKVNTCVELSSLLTTGSYTDWWFKRWNALRVCMNTTNDLKMKINAWLCQSKKFWSLEYVYT